jgi:hypothetical protein
MRRFPVRKALRLLAGMALAGAFTLTLSCVPPYFAEIDAAARLIRHMSPAGTVAPVSVQDGAAGPAATVRFLPSRPTATSIQNASITSGFVVASSPSMDYLTFVYVNGSGQPSNGLTGYPLTVSGADPNFPLYEYDVISSPATQPSIIVFRYDPVTPGNSTYQEMQGDPTTGQFLQPAAYISQLFAAGAVFLAANPPVGCSIAPTGTTPDTFTFILQNGAAMNDGNTLVNNPSGVFQAGTVSGASPLPGLTPRALVFSNVKGGTLVGQYRSGNAWVTLQWVDGLPGTTMTGVTKRLDAVLSDGDLLSTEGGNFTLYDSGGTGTQVFSTPLNGMQFCYEAWVGSTPYVFFTVSVIDRHGNTIFNVFAIPTSQVRTLGQ